MKFILRHVDQTALQQLNRHIRDHGGLPELLIDAPGGTVGDLENCLAVVRQHRPDVYVRRAYQLLHFSPFSARARFVAGEIRNF